MTLRRLAERISEVVANKLFDTDFRVHNTHKVSDSVQPVAFLTPTEDGKYQQMASYWLGGRTIEINGTYGKVGNGDGRLTIVPAEGDEFIIISAKLNWAGHFDATAGHFSRYLSDDTFEVMFARYSNTSGNLTVPRDSWNISASGNYIVSPDLWTRLIADSQKFNIGLDGMNNGEDATLVASLRSMKGLEPTITVETAGDTWT